MELSDVERVMIGLLVGNTPQRRPADMRMAVRVLELLEITESMIIDLDGMAVSALAESQEHEGIEVELSPDEAKFIVKVMVQNGNFGGRMLRLLIPLWERLYPNWEELAVEGEPEGRGRRGR